MRIYPVLTIIVLTALPSHAQTGLLDSRSARFFSHEGNIAFLVAGTVSGTPRDRGRALLTTTALVTGLKILTHERRPDGTTTDSFPSGHAAAAFTLAALAAQQARTRTEAGLWYVGAAAIADSRVTLRRHYPRDVVAGALLGLLVAHTPSLRLRF